MESGVHMKHQLPGRKESQKTDAFVPKMCNKEKATNECNEPINKFSQSDPYMLKEDYLVLEKQSNFTAA